MSQPLRKPRDAKPWLLAVIRDLRDAVNRMTEPHDRYINNTYLKIPSLYDQLHTAVIAGQQSNTGGGGGTKSRPPFWVDAADQLNNLDLMVSLWATYWLTEHTLGTPAHLRNMVTRAWTPDDATKIRRLTGIINAWADDIDKLLNHDNVKFITAACPACGASTVQHRDSAGELIRSPALQVITELGATCQNCDHHWAPNRYIDLCKELGMALPEGVLE